MKEKVKKIKMKKNHFLLKCKLSLFGLGFSFETLK